MANSFDSNFTRKLAEVFLEGVETERIHSKNVNTQLLEGKFNPSTGTIVDFRRPTDYVSKRTADGDISAGPRSDIITGKASGTVQDYFTVDVEYDEVDEALKMDKLTELLRPMARRIVTDLELDFAVFMRNNAGLLAGVPAVAATTWDHVAEAGAVMASHGVGRENPWFYTTNPFTQKSLASNQRALGAGGATGAIINESHKRATITERFAGFDRVMSADTLPNLTIAAGADRVGTLNANPDVTYLTAKDTMTQSLVLAGFQANLVIQAGEIIQITGRNRVNLSTRKLILDGTAAPILFTGVVTAAVTLDGAGAGTVVVTGPAVFEAAGAYNTVDSAPVAGDIATLLGTAADILQPNLFWQKNAFGIGSVPIKKLYATDTLATTEDGLQFRVTRYSDGDANKQIVRFDFHPAYATFNPFMAGQGFGS